MFAVFVAYSFRRYSLSIYYIPGTVLDVGDWDVKDLVPALKEATIHKSCVKENKL